MSTLAIIVITAIATIVVAVGLIVGIARLLVDR